MEKIRSFVVAWPALLTLEKAAQYLSLDIKTLAFLAQRRSVFPVLVDKNEKRLRRVDLDKMIGRFEYDTSFGDFFAKERILRLDQKRLMSLQFKSKRY